MALGKQPPFTLHVSSVDSRDENFFQSSFVAYHVAGCLQRASMPGVSPVSGTPVPKMEAQGVARYHAFPPSCQATIGDAIIRKLNVVMWRGGVGMVFQRNGQL